MKVSGLSRDNIILQTAYKMSCRHQIHTHKHTELNEIISQSQHVHQENKEKILSVKADKDLKRPNAPVKTRNGNRSRLDSDKLCVDSIYYSVLAGDTFKANSRTKCILCYWFAVRGFKAPLIDLIRNCGRCKIAVNKSRRGTVHTRCKIKVNIDSRLTPFTFFMHIPAFIETFINDCLSKGNNVCSNLLCMRNDFPFWMFSECFQSNQSQKDFNKKTANVLSHWISRFMQNASRYWKKQF